jgi:hemerythrin-like domain-containing protein
MHDPASDSRLTRRQFIGKNVVIAASAIGAPTLAAGLALADVASTNPSEGVSESALEDLMFEHGVLERLLLIYDKSADLLDQGKRLPNGVLADAGDIIQKFVHDYHEKMEEDHLFPRFVKAHRQADLVDTLKAQHNAGRDLAKQIKPLAAGAPDGSTPDGKKLAQFLRSAGTMYYPHLARENSVLFPAALGLVTEYEYKRLAEVFEQVETKTFGEKGREKVTAQVVQLEETLGIADLTKFTVNA